VDFTASIELETPFPSRNDDADTLATELATDLEVHGGIVTRSLTGRVQVVFTVQAPDLRTATHTALAVLVSTGRRPFTVEVCPRDEFARRMRTTVVPDLVSVSQAAEILGVSRQRVLELAKAGKLDAVKVGDTWVIPAAAVETREGQTGLRWSGSLLITDVLYDGKIVTGDGVDVAQQPLPVYDEQEQLIGLARTVRREQGNWWSANGTVLGLAPGDYRIAPRVHVIEQVHNGDYMRINRCVITGLTVLTTAGRESSFGDQTQITVTDGHGWMDLSNLREHLQVRRETGAVEVVSYP
jgi:excisionase family DNA binding protein